jgi:RNA polymerase sigma factor (TIGR02999 family)
MAEVTQLLSAIEAGDPHAAGELLPLVYDELRRLAARRLAREAGSQTLEPTALVHEVYLRLVGGNAAAHWDGRGHFFAAAAEAMRRILVENARRKKRHKHGGGRQRVALDGQQLAIPLEPEWLLALDEALDHLANDDPAAAEVVKLHCFAGLSLDQVGVCLGVSGRTARRQWAYARAWLRCCLNEDTGPAAS